VCGWQAIIFDLDDTLYPERAYVLSGMRAVAAWAERAWGLPADRSFDELCGLFDDGVRARTFNRWLARRGMESADRVDALVEVYRGHEPRIEPYRGARPLLRRLARSCRLGVVTDGYLHAQQRKMAALGLVGHFQAIVYSDQWGRDAWKPSCRPFQHVLEELSAAPARAVYVGDNPRKDFRGARRLGMQTIRIHQPDGLYRHLRPDSEDDEADWEVSGFRGLEALFESGEWRVVNGEWKFESKERTSATCPQHRSTSQLCLTTQHSPLVTRHSPLATRH
jgi:putative hydrolase of the HAD superfamily